MYLDSGNAHSQTRMVDILKDVLEKISSNSLILRMDSAFGSSENVSVLKASKAKFFVKCISPKRAKKLTKKVLKKDWEKIDDSVDI